MCGSFSSGLDARHLGHFLPAEIFLSLHVLQAGSPPDVWLQLLERCAAEPGCQPMVLRNLAHQLAEQRQQIARLQELLQHPSWVLLLRLRSWRLVAPGLPCRPAAALRARRACRHEVKAAATGTRYTVK